MTRRTILIFLAVLAAGIFLAAQTKGGRTLLILLITGGNDS
jgi:hypothetical protein